MEKKFPDLYTLCRTVSQFFYHSRSFACEERCEGIVIRPVLIQENRVTRYSMPGFHLPVNRIFNNGLVNVMMQPVPCICISYFILIEYSTCHAGHTWFNG